MLFQGIHRLKTPIGNIKVITLVLMDPAMGIHAIHAYAAHGNIKPPV